ncbi:MAG: bifunctional precorrin-2 dehydrogenase/sirohydrochlorin ferrochelatase [Lachnospiraceae bacterium]|nr:bifunctional precorrin-2 dehydrogenase/sirohydrochlorin ferrochelatase [Lachnospiraceae bacterium]
MGEYPFFPVFIDLSQKKLIVFGAGKIARRRIAVLSQFTPQLTVIAPDCLAEVGELAACGKIIFLKKAYEEGDLEGADIVFAATNDHDVNNRIYDDCKKRGITVNVSTDRSKSDFYFPGIARKEDIVVGVTASGKDHAGARRVSEKMREMLDHMENV